jgi:hypothetical protein
MGDGVIHRAGPAGPELAARLLAIARDWIEVGLPGLDRYGMRFIPLARQPAESDGTEAPTPTDSVEGPWAIDRIDHRQDIYLLPPQ